MASTAANAPGAQSLAKHTLDLELLCMSFPPNLHQRVLGQGPLARLQPFLQSCLRVFQALVRIERLKPGRKQTIDEDFCRLEAAVQINGRNQRLQGI